MNKLTELEQEAASRAMRLLYNEITLQIRKDYLSSRETRNAMFRDRESISQAHFKLFKVTIE